MGSVVFRHAGLTWIVAAGHEDIVRARADWSHERLAGDPGCRIVKRDAKRFAGFLGRVFVKSQLYTHRLFGKSPSRKEWDHARYALAQGLSTAAPLACGTRARFFGPSQSLFLAEEVPQQGTLRDLIETKLGEGDEQLLPAVEALGALLRRVHDAGLLHWDLNPGNILLRPRSGAASEFTLIDLKSAEIRPEAPRALRLENVAKAILQLRRFEFLPPWRPAAQAAYLRGYLRGEGEPDRFFAELQPSLVKRGRILSDHAADDFERGDARHAVVRDGDLQLYCRQDALRGIGVDLLPQELRSPRALRQAATSAEGVVVPSTRPPWNLLIRTVEARPAKPFWLHALRCSVLGLPCLPPLAMVAEQGTARAFCQILDSELRPAAEAGESADLLARRFAEELHAFDFSAALLEARHLRVRVPRGAHEAPALLAIAPEALASRASVAPDVERIRRLLA